MNPLARIRGALRRQLSLSTRLDLIQESLGRIESRLHANVQGGNPRDYEFKVYSQWGEDGIIDHLLTRVPIPSRTFVEFGVENYTEANTLFLLKHRYWRGLVIDGSPENIAGIRHSEAFWKFDLCADCSFITKDNINEIIARNAFSGDLGILSVDIDGNDYWVWEAIEVVSPRIVICEYNSLFGPTAKVSIPYQADFSRRANKTPMGYFGASIAALGHLGAAKGYSLVAGNSAGNNVFFVRNDCLGTLQAMSPESAYVPAAFREDRSPDGEVDLIRFADRREAIERLPVIDVTTGQRVQLSELAGSARPQ
jgi:hypothetical protein